LFQEIYLALQFYFTIKFDILKK